MDQNFYALKGIRKPAMRRICRRAGIKRISGQMYTELRERLLKFMENVIRDALTFSQNANRSTVMLKDVLYALKRLGRTHYYVEPESARRKK